MITEAFLTILDEIPIGHEGARDFCIEFFEQARRNALVDLRSFENSFRGDCMLAARSTEVNVKFLDANGKAKFEAARVKELSCQEKYSAIRFLSPSETKDI